MIQIQAKSDHNHIAKQAFDQAMESTQPLSSNLIHSAHRVNYDSNRSTCTAALSGSCKAESPSNVSRKLAIALQEFAFNP